VVEFLNHGTGRQASGVWFVNGWNAFPAGYPSFNEEGAVSWAANTWPVLPEPNCDLEKSDPVARDWFKESQRARHKGGPPGSLEAIGAAGQGTRQRHRHDVASRRPASVITLRDCTVEPADHDGPPGIVGAVPRLSPRHRCCVLPAIAAPRCGQPPRLRQRRRWFEAAHLGRLNSKSRILVRVCAEGVRAGDHGLWIHHS